MGKLICHQKGNLFIKCKSCGYSWNTPVVMHQEVDDTCPNCGTHTQHHAVITVEGTKPTDSVDIPEFMDKPTNFITLSDEEYNAIINRNTLAIRKHYKLGFTSGLSLGLSIGFLILGIILFFLFAPMTILPV